MDIILETKDLCKYYGEGENLVKAVDKVNIQIQQGEFVTILGKSGSGKSTLLHMLGALDRPTSGQVWLAGKNILKTLGLDGKARNLPNTLSGGQQQRTAIARAIAAKPSIILADEPTGNLDSKTGDEVMALLKFSAKKYGQTLVVITHDEDIAQMADRTIIIEDGKVVK